MYHAPETFAMTECCTELHAWFDDENKNKTLVLIAKQILDSDRQYLSLMGFTSVKQNCIKYK
jgi:hypothetical protein